MGGGSLRFVESAILFESGLNTLCDKVIAVTAPDDVRIERTLQRDYNGSHSKEHIAAVRNRIQAQMTNEERTKRATLFSIMTEHDLFLCLQSKHWNN